MIGVFIAQTAPPGMEGLAQYGLLGVLVSILFWFAWQAYKRERDANDAKDRIIEAGRAREQAMAEKMAGDVTEALKESNRLLATLSRRRAT